MALVGFGLGLSIPASNVLVGRMNPNRRGAALSLLNLMWGVGAIGCQLLFYVLAGRMELGAAPWVLAAAGALACAVAFRWIRPTTRVVEADADASGPAVVAWGPLGM